MCAICGEIVWDPLSQVGRQMGADRIQRMCSVMASRGPQAEGIVQRHNEQSTLTLGHRRLSIIDLSEGGNQPMQLPPNPVAEHAGVLGLRNECFSLVFNGCIYNHVELRKKFKRLGAHFTTESDTEVILHAWQRLGVSCLEELDGMFAFALWDFRDQALYLVRDRFGIKPLYYTTDNVSGTTSFASTLPALLHTPGLNTSIDEVALHFMYHIHGVVPPPNTIIKGIKKVKPASYLRITQKGVEEKHYWHLKSPPQSSLSMTEAEWEEKTFELLYQAIKKRFMSADVPVGVFLSGGLDSSLIVALARQIQQEEGLSNPLHTFSIGFENVGGAVGSEFAYSDQVAKRFSTDHHRYCISDDQLLRELPNAVQAMSEPMFGQDCVAFYLLSEQASKHAKVVLSGQGADEVFAGYFWYPLIHQLDNGTASPYDTVASIYLDRDHSEWKSMFNPQWHTGDLTKQWIEQALENKQPGTLLKDLLALDVSQLIVDDPVKRVDNMTMAWGLEGRIPFLDKDLVEFVSQIPVDFKLRSGGKGSLKRIAKNWFDADFIQRKKEYFPTPSVHHIRGEFLTLMCDTLRSNRARQRGLFQQTYLDQLISDPDQHFTRLGGSKLWHCAVLEMWLQTHGL